MKKRVAILGAMTALIAAAPAGAKASTLDGWWRFDDSSATVAQDSSQNNNDATVSGGATHAPGYFGSAMSFNGSSRVDVPDSSSLEPSSAVTVTAWVKSSNPGGEFKYLVAKGASGCNAASYAFYTGINGGLMFYASQNGGMSYALSPDAGTGVWNGDWHLIVGTYDGKSVRLYVDGNQIGNGTAMSGPVGYGLPDGNDLFFGHYDGCANTDFTGSIDEPTVWSRAFSPLEVKADYTLLAGLHRVLGRLSSWPGS